MAFEDLQDRLDVLKNVYLPIRKRVFPFLTPLVANARKGTPDSVRWGGNDLFFTAKLDRRGGFVSSARGFLPDMQSATEQQARLGITRMYARVQLDPLSDLATANTRDAFISASKKATEDVMEQWQLEQERALQGDSTGVRALVKTVTDTTHIVVDSPYGIASSGPGNLHLVEGDTIAVLSADGTTLRGKSAISTITRSGDDATLTLATAINGMIATDVVVTAVTTATNSSDTSYGAEPHGLKSIMDVEAAFATFEGINHSRWVAQKLTSTTIDESILMKLLLTIESKAGVNFATNPKALLLLCSPGLWLTYGESLLGIRRFNPPPLELKGGFVGVQVANATLIRDPWMPRGRVYAVHLADTIFIDLLDFGRAKYQDSPEWVRASNQDAYEAFFATYWNYGATNRATHGVVSGITDTVDFSPIM